MNHLRISFRAAASIIVCGLLVLQNAAQADIPAWRGTLNGIYDAESAPTDWEGQKLFQVPLDSKSNGTPILVKDRLIFTAEPDQLICVNSKTGELIWQRSNDLYTLRNVSDKKRAELETYKADIEIYTQQARKLKNDIRRLESTLARDADNKEAATAKLAKEAEMQTAEDKVAEMRKVPFFKDFDMPPAHTTNGYTSYSPHYDGERIYVQYGYGVVVAYDLDGNRQWVSFLEHPDHNWGGATMPQIVDGKLIVRFDDYHALEPTTGKKIWSTPSDIVFGTPAPFMIGKQHFLFTPRGEVIRVKDGKVLKEGLVYIHPTRGWSIFNTPAVVDGVIYAASGVEKENGDAYAYKIPSTLKEFNKNKGLTLLWHTSIDKNRYYSSPLIHKDLVYLVSRDNLITTLEAGSGEVVYTQQIKGVTGTAYPSLVLADDKIYMGVEDGSMVIFKPGRSFEEITRHNLGAYRATPIFDNHLAYLRTYDSLIAAGSL
jgi:outer membrane protein assembly factor BamB